MCRTTRALLIATLLILFTRDSARATALCEEVRAALADARRIPKGSAKYWRYLTVYNIRDLKLRELHEQIVVLYHLNCLSHEPDIARPVKVSPTLYRINTLYYGEQFAKTYENLAKTNAYFPCFERVQFVPLAKVEKVEHAATDIWVIRGSFVRVQLDGVRQGEATYRKTGPNEWTRHNFVAEALLPKQVELKEAKVATFLPADEILELSKILESVAPLLRADFVFYRTVVSDNKTGDGYYDFHGLKTRDDAYKLAGLDLDVVARLRLDRAAMVGKSRVAVNKIRQVWWVKAYTGSWWQTFDINAKGKAERNLLVLTGQALNKVDFKHDAEETYFHLSNGLWAVFASDANGVLQATVPDTVAHDKTSTDNDGRIRNCYSCFGCHMDGLQPIADWGRSAYRASENFLRDGQVALGSGDPKRLLRNQQLYLSNLEEKFEADQLAFAKKVKEINGMKPPEIAAGIRKVFDTYYNTELGMKELAVELGIEDKDWREALVSYLDDRTRQGLVVDPILAAVAKEKNSLPMIRDHVEERFAIMQAIYGEWVKRRKRP